MKSFLLSLAVENNTKMHYVKINFTGNTSFGFYRCCGQVSPEPNIFHVDF